MSKLKKAMEKAKAAREALYPVQEKGEAENAQDSDKVTQAAPAPSPVREQAKTVRKKDAGSEALSVAYSKTRVKRVDPAILKGNKVISLFHENRMTDHFKTVRAQILRSLEQMGKNSLLITSANPQEGKTFMTINLGVSIAQEMDRTALLVDADLRKQPKTHCDFSQDFFGICAEHGLSDYLTGSAEIEDLLWNPGFERLTILSAGMPIANCAEYLGSPRMESLIAELQERYAGDRIVIFDSPALLTFPDPLILAQSIDAVLLVVEAERTTSEDLKRCKELLAGCSIIGTVLNKAR
mgnify:CR=1 FL=1